MDWFPKGGKAWRRFGVTWLFIALVAEGFIHYMTVMPGHSYAGSLPPLTPQENAISANLKPHVFFLSEKIGERNTSLIKALRNTAQYIEDALKNQGYQVESQEYMVQGIKVRNLVAEIHGEGKADEIVVIGAHYDTAEICPGADDNASGIAVLLELARLLKDTHPARTLRFAAFVNEEPPYFQTADMGSLVYARKARAHNENIVAAISLETIGMYSDTDGSQHYPSGLGLLYPSKGNFIGFVGNLSSRTLVRRATRIFRETTSFPSEGSAVPSFIPGAGWSDHWSFWQAGYPAIMVTDTALFRNPNYHYPSDQPDTLDYDRMARVTQGLAKVIGQIAA